MESGQSVEEWARTAHFPQPVRWGEIETAILERDLPQGEDGGPALSMWGRVGASWIGIVIIVLLTFGSAAIGLAMVVVGTATDDAGAAQTWLENARVPFVVAPLVQLFLLQVWWETRRRGAMVVPASALTVVASVAAYLVVALASDVPDVPWLSMLMVVAAVCGCVVLATALASQPEGRDKSRKPPRRGPRSSRKQGRCLQARERVLQVLLERRLVDLDEADRIRLLEMPLGYWSELDGVDEAEWRRILELRHVGWRDFDNSDRR